MKKIAIVWILCCLGLANEALAQKLYTWPMGVQAYTFRKHFPQNALGTLDIIQKMGITELEGGAPKGMTAEEFKAQCAARGISIPSTGCDFNELEKDPVAVANKAKALGASFVMCAWIPHKGNDFTKADADRAIAVFNAGGKVLKEHGITFTYHDHGYEFHAYEDGTLMDYIIRNTDPAYVSFEMDVLWTMHGGGADMPVKLLKKYPNRWKLMHVKDLRKGVQGDLTGHTPAENDVPVGSGQGNWKSILKLAKKNGVQHLFIEDESDKELQNVPLSIQYLKSL